MHWNVDGALHWEIRVTFRTIQLLYDHRKSYFLERDTSSQNIEVIVTIKMTLFIVMFGSC